MKNVNLLDTYANGMRGNISYRKFVEEYLTEFNKKIVEDNTSYGSFTLAVITDTHAKDTYNSTFYGINGLVHTQELSFFDKNYKIDLKAHLGDVIDGSDSPENSKTLLRLTLKTLNNSKLPFAIAKGNHDDNDKFDEHTFSKKASFNENTYSKIVNPVLYNQPQIKYISEETGLYYFDKGAVRTIFINTSDVPYKLNVMGVKKYDVKKIKAVRQKQVEELVEILEKSSGRKIVVFGHSPLVNPKGESSLAYNGISMHELFVAFNQKLKGKVDNKLDNEFSLNVDFDFSHIKNAKISAYICGHRHIEKNYMFDDINYILLNCSALMGKNHGLTTNYNKKWNRKINEPSEFAGYIIDINPKTEIINVLGYGAATNIRQFQI
ncbi:metallophosphoesterase family protein [Companilactobacillus sp. DQM5]|uniref:metallophosphoesterase family protein n=1 Tax=Companilactobacillus sp. DQM5 TaxID=3463359 RepID=UPI00405A1219